MAYTQYGGDLLPIEVSIAQGGKGNVVITGNLKETMKESVNVALGYVKANAAEFGIDYEIFQKLIYTFTYQVVGFQRWSKCRDSTNNSDHLSVHQ